jgi:signal transduction histidine kinase
VEIERKQVGEALDAKVMELDRTNKDLHKLAMEMTMLVDKERKRCAGLLHDDIGQNLVAARLVFSSFSKLCDRCSDTARETMDEANSLLESTINRVRAIVSDLHHAHPYGEELVSKKGLKDAVVWYAKTVFVQPGVEIAVDIDGAVEEMPEDFKQNLYLIVQECFQNVMKHSLASSVELRCKVDKERLIFSLKDNGVGFDDIRLKKGGGVGLRLMRERVRSMNGVLTIRSEPHKGTEVLAEFLRL